MSGNAHGFTNAQATLMQIVNSIFKDILSSCMMILLDYILMHFHTVDKYFESPRQVLSCYNQYTLHFILKKYSFLHNSKVFQSFSITPNYM